MVKQLSVWLGDHKVGQKGAKGASYSFVGIMWTLYLYLCDWDHYGCSEFILEGSKKLLRNNMHHLFHNFFGDI